MVSVGRRRFSRRSSPSTNVGSSASPVRGHQSLFFQRKHVWTTPGKIVAMRAVGASHVSGLFARHMTVGPDVVRGSGSNQTSGPEALCLLPGHPDQQKRLLRITPSSLSHFRVSLAAPEHPPLPSLFRWAPQAQAPGKLLPWSGSPRFEPSCWRPLWRRPWPASWPVV